MSTAAQALPGNQRAAWPEWLHHIRIEEGPVPRDLAAGSARGILWQAAPGRFLLRVPGTAAYLAEDGERITVAAEPAARAEAISRLLRMTPLAAVLYQRGTLAFHAAAAANAEGAVLLAGDSCAGKSAVLLCLLRRGWKMLADELSAIDFERGQVRVAPAFPEIRIRGCADETEEGTTNSAPGKRGRWQVVSAAGQFSAAAQSLRAIYWLSVHNKETVEMREVTGMERFRALGTLTYNSHIADALLDRAAYMHQASAVSQIVPMFRLFRPRGRKWGMEEVAERIAGAGA